MADQTSFGSAIVWTVGLTALSVIVYTFSVTTMPQPPAGPVIDPGRIETKHPGSLASGCSGVVIAKVVVSDEVSLITVDPGSPPYDRSPVKTITPVYVVEGEVELTLTVSDELRVQPSTAPTKTLNVFEGIPAETSWNVEGLRPGFGSMTLTGQQISLRDESLVADNLDSTQIDNMEITLEVVVEQEANCDSPGAEPKKEETAGPRKDEPGSVFGVVLPSLQWLIAGGAISVPFLLWLVSRVPWLKQRFPKIAAAFGWLPEQLREFKKKD